MPMRTGAEEILPSMLHAVFFCLLSGRLLHKGEPNEARGFHTMSPAYGYDGPERLGLLSSTERPVDRAYSLLTEAGT